MLTQSFRRLRFRHVVVAGLLLVAATVSIVLIEGYLSEFGSAVAQSARPDSPPAGQTVAVPSDQARVELLDAAPAQGAETWHVTSIVDGDTLVVASGGAQEHLRVIGIDTPERGVCGYEEASAALAALVLDQEVELSVGAADDRDRYDRILRYVDVGGVDAGLSMIEQGLAIARYDSRDGYGRHPREDAYVAADAGTADACGRPAAQHERPRQGAKGFYSGTGTTAGGGAWSNCSEARAAGAAPVLRGDAGYGPHLDGDGDGVGCE